jgi:hypothetical protein
MVFLPRTSKIPISNFCFTSIQVAQKKKKTVELYHRQAGGRWSSGKYVGTTCLRAVGESPAPPAVWVFWRLIWRTESLDRGLILVCRFSLGSAFQLRLRLALVYKVGCTCGNLYCSQMSKRLLQRGATCASGMVTVSECLS